MIQLNCTKKLLTKLSPDSEGLLPEGRAILNDIGYFLNPNPLSGWQANLFTIQRRNCILMLHNTTRFPLLIIGLVKKDYPVLDYLFSDALMNTLLKIGANEEQMQTATEALAPLSIQSGCDRSVQGTMNQMKGSFEHMVWYDDIKVEELSPYRTAAWLADRPCTVKGQKDCIWPKEAMLNLLDKMRNGLPKSSKLEFEVGSSVPIDIEQSNVVSIMDYQFKASKEKH